MVGPSRAGPDSDMRTSGRGVAGDGAAALSIRIIHGDCRDVLRELPDASVQCCVTSPPYWGLRDYGVDATIWGGDPECEHEWGDLIAVNATNHTDKRRWNHTRNGRDEE